MKRLKEKDRKQLKESKQTKIFLAEKTTKRKQHIKLVRMFSEHNVNFSEQNTIFSELWASC